jgi:hypothetical protein
VIDRGAPRPGPSVRNRKWNGEKSLYRIADAGHTEWMHDDNEHFIALAETIANWLDEYTRWS